MQENLSLILQLTAQRWSLGSSCVTQMITFSDCFESAMKLSNWSTVFLLPSSAITLVA